MNRAGATTLSDSRPVKRKLTLFAFLAAACLATSLLTLAVTRSGPTPAKLAAEYGNTLARTLAYQSIDPLVSHDPVELGLLTNRLTRLPAVHAATIYGVDNHIVAGVAASRPGPAFSHPITLNDSVIGIVRITLEPGYFDANSNWSMAGALLSALLAAAIFARLFPAAALAPDSSPEAPKSAGGTAHANRAARADEISTPGSARDEGEMLAAIPESPMLWHLVGAHLDNHHNLTPAERANAMRTCHAMVTQLASLYDAGAVLDTPQGHTLAFRDTQTQDDAFQALCAALVLRRSLERSGGRGVFRVGVSSAQLQGFPGSPDDARALVQSGVPSDVALLASGSRGSSVCVSEYFLGFVALRSRIVADPFEHPLREDLNARNGDCYQVRALTDNYDDLIERQVRRLVA